MYNVPKTWKLNQLYMHYTCFHILFRNLISYFSHHCFSTKHKLMMMCFTCYTVTSVVPGKRKECIPRRLLRNYDLRCTYMCWLKLGLVWWWQYHSIVINSYQKKVLWSSLAWQALILSLIEFDLLSYSVVCTVDYFLSGSDHL